MKIVTIVGARPQFIKAAPVSHLLRNKKSEVLIHTGQHYDNNLSDVFFNELAIPSPDYNLGVGSGPHGEQTGAMLTAIEKILIKEIPDWALIYGDTNSTLAGALAAAKLHIPVAHIEAGLRSFNRLMPEEINRVVSDHLSDLLLCPSEVAVSNLAAEGITQGVHNVGDVMADALFYAVKTAYQKSGILTRLSLAKKKYLLATVHRAENTDDHQNLKAIFIALSNVGETVVFPIHPRTRSALKSINNFSLSPNIHLIDPVSYLDMVRLESEARMILTDSGGIQKEAYWLGVPCITLRDETEWVETVQVGWNRLAGANSDLILELVQSFTPPSARPSLYGDGNAAERCVALLN